MATVMGYVDGGGAIVGVLVVYFLVVLGFFVGFGFAGRALFLSKGRPGSSGFCLGFFLGVLGLIIAACLPAAPAFEAEKMHRQMAMMGMAPGQPYASSAQGNGYGYGGAPSYAATAAQWAADPYRRYDLRYFDGVRWTEHVSTNGSTSIDNSASVPSTAKSTAFQLPERGGFVAPEQPGQQEWWNN
jgi:hypothetical protein